MSVETRMNGVNSETIEGRNRAVFSQFRSQILDNLPARYTIGLSDPYSIAPEKRRTVADILAGAATISAIEGGITPAQVSFNVISTIEYNFNPSKEGAKHAQLQIIRNADGVVKGTAIQMLLDFYLLMINGLDKVPFAAKWSLYWMGLHEMDHAVNALTGGEQKLNLEKQALDRTQSVDEYEHNPVRLTSEINAEMAALRGFTKIPVVNAEDQHARDVVVRVIESNITDWRQLRQTSTLQVA